MTKTPITRAQLGMPAAHISHIYVRLRGTQHADLTVYHAKTDHARIALTWGGILMTFLNAQAAQGVLEGISAAKSTLVYLPAEVGPGPQEPYERPTIAIDWNCRPPYAVTPRSAVTPDQRRTIRWSDCYLGQVTFQILDRAAFHSAVEVLRLAHRTATAVCIDGHRFRADPTRDDFFHGLVRRLDARGALAAELERGANAATAATVGFGTSLIVGD